MREQENGRAGERQPEESNEIRRQWVRKIFTTRNNKSTRETGEEIQPKHTQNAQKKKRRRKNEE